LHSEWATFLEEKAMPVDSENVSESTGLAQLLERLYIDKTSQKEDDTNHVPGWQSRRQSVKEEGMGSQ